MLSLEDDDVVDYEDFGSDDDDYLDAIVDAKMIHLLESCYYDDPHVDDGFDDDSVDDVDDVDERVWYDNINYHVMS